MCDHWDKRLNNSCRTIYVGNIHPIKRRERIWMQSETIRISLNTEQSEKLIACLMDDIKKIAIELKLEREKSRDETSG